MTIAADVLTLNWTIQDCPCSSRATLLTDGEWFYVECLGHRAHRGPSSLSRFLAISRWNRRAITPPAGPGAGAGK